MKPNRMTVSEAAKKMGVSQQYVRVCLQKKLLPFGTATKISGNRYTYYISPKLFNEYTGAD